MSGPLQEDPASPAEPDAWQLSLQADELLDRRRLPQARQVLAQGLRQAPEHLGLLLASARADYIEDRYARARDTLAHALRVAPAHPHARWLLFLVEMHDGRHVEAEELVLGLLHESPDVPAYYAGYSRLMLHALHFRKAGALADEALRLAPNDEEALRSRVLCDLVERRRGAVDQQALVRLLAAHPDEVQTLRLVVVALIQAERVREARALARELLRAQPDDPWLLDLLRNLQVHTHWSLWPLWPLQRWGWYGAIGFWVLSLLLLQVLGRVAPAAAGPVQWTILAYALYSWIWPPLLRRWQQHQDR